MQHPDATWATGAPGDPVLGRLLRGQALWLLLLPIWTNSWTVWVGWSPTHPQRGCVSAQMSVIDQKPEGGKSLSDQVP